MTPEQKRQIEMLIETPQTHTSMLLTLSSPSLIG